MFFASVITSSFTPGWDNFARFFAPLIVWITSLPVMPVAKGTEQPCSRTREIRIIFKFVFVPFIVLIYLILVEMSIPKKPLFYAMNLIRATENNPKLMMVTAGIPAYHNQSTKASHSILITGDPHGSMPTASKLVQQTLPSMTTTQGS
jgi:hypothetical protein